jgi:molecular chaperone DnaJ
MAEKDFYKILGVEKNASKEEIRTAYKRLAKKYHPDLNKNDPNAGEKFKELNEAASVLADEGKRARYDQYGSEAVNGQGFSGDFDFRDFANFGSFDFDDIFDTFFNQGGGRRRRFQHDGSDLRFDLEISLEEAADGTTKTILMPRQVVCSECDGKGASKDSDVVVCPTCDGRGMVRQTRRTPFGIFATTTTCGRCNGEGRVIEHPCRTCGGAGSRQEKSKIEVKIPEGVEEGTRLRISGQGDAGSHGGGAGDLYLVIHLKNHKTFERDGNDLWIEIPISITQATLGTTIEVPLLNDKTSIKIPAGTQPSTVFKLPGKGMPSLHERSSGDLNVKVTVEIPTSLTAKQKELFRQLEKDDDGNEKNSEKGKKGFFDKFAGVFL